LLESVCLPLVETYIIDCLNTEDADQSSVGNNDCFPQGDGSCTNQGDLV